MGSPGAFVRQRFPMAQTVANTLISHSISQEPQGIKKEIASIARSYNPYQQLESEKARIEELETQLEAATFEKEELKLRILQLEAELGVANQKTASNEKELLAKCQEISTRANLINEKAAVRRAQSKIDKDFLSMNDQVVGA